MQGSTPRLPAGQTEKRDWAGRETGRFGVFGRHGTRRASARNPAPRGDFRQEKGPGDYPSPSDWWRRGESNPRPQVLDSRIYVRSSLFVSRLTLPEEQGRRSASGRCLLTKPPRRTVARDPVSASPGSPAQAPSGQRLGGIKPPERSCRRWQLSFCTVFNEGHAPRYAPEGSQPTSKPVAPNQVPREYSRLRRIQGPRGSRAGSSAATR